MQSSVNDITLPLPSSSSYPPHTGGLINFTAAVLQVTNGGLGVLKAGSRGEQWKHVLYLIKLINSERSQVMSWDCCCLDREIQQQ